jgi:hypothetical protein
VELNTANRKKRGGNLLRNVTQALECGRIPWTGLGNGNGQAIWSFYSTDSQTEVTREMLKLGFAGVQGSEGTRGAQNQQRRAHKGLAEIP